MVDHLGAELVVNAPDMDRLDRDPRATVVHFDLGTKYCSRVFGKRLRQAGLMSSMGIIGDSLDNTVAEGFFSSLQREPLVRHR